MHESYGYRSKFGKSTCVIRCPFCKQDVTVYMWSLAGSGKKCLCGALHSSLGRTFKEIKVEMNEKEVLEIIRSGKDTAYGILHDADPKLIKRFEKIDKMLVNLISDVRKHFPDAEYYSASDTFCLMLGSSHSNTEVFAGLLKKQPELIAHSGDVLISGGDF